MTTFDATKTKLLSAFDKLRVILSDLKDEGGIEACELRRQRLELGQLLIVVCGEFKSGKSSLINALLGEPDLLPSDVDIATSTVILVRHGAERRVVVFTPSDKDVETTEVSFEELARYASQAHGRDVAQKARSIMVDLPLPLLKEGVVVADTPGVGGLNKSYSEVTFAALADSGPSAFRE